MMMTLEVDTQQADSSTPLTKSVEEGLSLPLAGGEVSAASTDEHQAETMITTPLLLRATRTPSPRTSYLVVNGGGPDIPTGGGSTHSRSSATTTASSFLAAMEAAVAAPRTLLEEAAAAQAENLSSIGSPASCHRSPSFTGGSPTNTTTITTAISGQPTTINPLKNRLFRFLGPRRSGSFSSGASGSSSLLLATAPSPAWLRMGAVICAWFLISVVAIVTTKLLLTEWWHVPPVVLTCQQLFLSSTLLRLKLALLSGGAQPVVLPNVLQLLPGWRSATTSSSNPKDNDDAGDKSGSSKTAAATPALKFVLLAGFFNTMDFLFSNSAFGEAAASFVETVKTSDPLSVTAVALVWKVDRINGRGEMISLALLVVGLFLSTWGNTEVQQEQEKDNSAASPSSQEEASEDKWSDSARAAALVVSANFCFAFRAMFQKKYRRRFDENTSNMVAGGTATTATKTTAGLLGSSSPTSATSSSYAAAVETEELNDENLLCRMQQVGWMCLLIPALFCCHDAVWDTIWDYQGPSSLLQDETFWLYVQVSLLNAAAYAVYNLASTYVLSNLTVLHHSTLQCVRRLFAVLSTCFFFGVPLSAVGAVGVLASFAGFCGFTYHRSVKKGKAEKHEK